MGEAPLIGQRPFYLLGHVGGRALDRIVAPVGCGCEYARKALTDPDPVARQVWGNDARPLQVRWRCKAAGLTPAIDRSELDDGCQEVLTGVDGLAGGDDCGAECPFAFARTDAARNVQVARGWREHGELRTRVGWPSLALCEAIDCVDRGINDRMTWEREHPAPRKPVVPDAPDE